MLVFLTVVTILFASFPALAKNQKSNIKIATSSLFDNQLELKTYDPECGINESCNVWKNFRNSHPFPYQTIAVSPAKNGDAVLIISEPPTLPGLTRNKLEQFVKTTFGADLIEYKTRRWMIGVDGWLEDAVARIKTSDPRYAKKPEKNPVLLDRVGVLQSVLFGTRLGSVIERADADYQSIAQGAASDVDATPSELSSWLQFNTEAWTPLNPYQSHFYISLNKLLSGSAPGAYIGAEKQLTLFVLPAKILDEARGDNAKMEALRAPFRLFAVATDEILGGVWNNEGGLALIGRSRRVSQTALPPLRFETFATLATENADELAQSYERTNLFAGILTVQTGLALQQSLTQASYTVFMTKTDVTSCPSFIERIDAANDSKANAFVSIHYDKATLFGFHGSLGIYNSNKASAATLAKDLLDNTSSALGLSNRDIKVDNDLAVLKKTLSNGANGTRMSAAMIEVGRLSYPDANIIHTPGSDALAAKSIQNGLNH